MKRTPPVWIPKANHFAHFSDRHEMRRGHPLRRYKLHRAPTWTAPTLPVNWYGSLTFAMDANDSLGDCGEAMVDHADNTFTGSNGVESNHALADLKKQYLAVSGGDNGLDEDMVVNQIWTKPGVAYDSDAIIYDALDIDATDATEMQSAIANFGCVMFAFSVPDAWISAFSPDGSTVWDAPATPNPNNGHFVCFNGVYENGNYHLLTWGSYCQITPAGVDLCEPSAFVVFSPRWFDPATGLAPNGESYETLAALWSQVGGKTVPPWIPSNPTHSHHRRR